LRIPCKNSGSHCTHLAALSRRPFFVHQFDVNSL
jgi:hypothetical protein